jgi:hypothetical protein
MNFRELYDSGLTFKEIAIRESVPLIVVRRELLSDGKHIRHQKYRNDTVSDKFWDRVHKTDSCWLWTGSLFPSGYGRIQIKGRSVRAHRLSWEIKNGDISSGLVVCHKCDNTKCVRPDHLFLGTHLDNARDRNSKGRQAKGETFKRSSLTENDVIDIRTLRAMGATILDLCDSFQVKVTTINDIVNRHSWKHVP